MRGKHASDEGFDLDNIPFKKILIFIVIIAVVIGAFWGGRKVYSSFLANEASDKKIEKKEVPDEIEVENMPTELDGYKVLGQLNIEKHNYSGYILDNINETTVSENTEGNEISEDINENNIDDENTNSNENEENTINETQTSDNYFDITDALKKGLVKLYGDKLNQKGNFTIIGHNEADSFSVLNELNVEDEFSIKTTSNIEKKYIITDIYTIEPDDLKSLMPNKDYTEVTLITCTSGSNQRLVVKALEENDYEIFKSSNDANNTNEEINTEDSNNINKEIT